MDIRKFIDDNYYFGEMPLDVIMAEIVSHSPKVVEDFIAANYYGLAQLEADEIIAGILALI